MCHMERNGQQKPAIKGWIQHPSPKQLNIGSGWFAEMDRVYSDEGNRFVVQVRSVQTDWGLVEHACIRNADETDIPWADKQRIKNEIFGRESTAIEVFPKESELVDKANMYHLWILHDKKLPFGIN